MNLSGEFRCVQGCLGPSPAYVTQNGWDLNLVNEVGQPSRAWIDYPGHVWAQYWNEGAVYSPDGFDNESVWQRVILRRCYIVAARNLSHYAPGSARDC